MLSDTIYKNLKDDKYGRRDHKNISPESCGVYFAGGDIDNRTTGSMERDAMQQGSRIHRKIQKRMGSDYRAEVPLKQQCPCDGFILQVEGRADGILTEEGQTVIDEIKGVLRDLDQIREPVGVHLAQAKCYAYIYASQNELEEIGVQMTYCNLETEEIKRFRQQYYCKELEKWFQDLIHAYEKWADFRLPGEKSETNPSVGRSSHFLTVRDSGIWQELYTVRSCAGKSCLFRHLPAWGRLWQPYFPQFGPWERIWERRFFI